MTLCALHWWYEFSSQASPRPFRRLKRQADAEAGARPCANMALNQRTSKDQLMRLKHLMNDRCHKLHFTWTRAFIYCIPKAHQDAVEIISSHISCRSRQQGPCLSLVVCDKGLDMSVKDFVGEIHAVYPLDLRKKTEKNAFIVWDTFQMYQSYSWCLTATGN